MTLLSDPWYEIMLHLNYEDLIKLCENHKIDKTYSNIIMSICNDDNFWKIKMDKDFNMAKLENQTWKESYQSIVNLINHLLQLNYVELSKACKEQNTITQLCNDDNFWKMKMDKDFGIYGIFKLENKTWRQCYQIMVYVMYYFNHKNIQLSIAIKVGEEPRQIVISEKSFPTATSENATVEYTITKDRNGDGMTVHVSKHIVTPRINKPDKIETKMFWGREVNNNDAITLLYILVGYKGYFNLRSI